MPVDETSLRERLRAVLSGFKIPRVIVSLEALPTNAVGKIDRVAVRALCER